MTVKKTWMRIFPATANAKLGPHCACTYSPRNTCPNDCPFKKKDEKTNGCYADGVRTACVWDKIEESAKRVDLAGLEAAVRELPPGYLLRHNVAGDIARPGTNSVNGPLLSELTRIYSRVSAWTYTHCAKTQANLKKLAAACNAGFTVNQSCERASDCDKAAAAGVPSVLAVVSFETMPKRTPAGLKIIPCPAQVNEHKSCSNCSARGPLCRMRDRSFVIAFEAHGTAIRKAQASIEAANAAA